ncbi:MAG: hypothetical protein IKU08_08240 [Clostridia bacterium]|nr:hypothetical protein [Clostridia bacterium]
MKKIIIAIVAFILIAAIGTGIYFVTANKNNGTVSVTVDEFTDNPDTLEALMTRPEKFTKVLENQYHLGGEKTVEFYECPEEWLTYTEFVTVSNSTDETITVFALDVADNGKDGVYICTSLEGDIEIEPGSTAPVYFNILCDNGDLSTDEAKALVDGMDIKLAYRDESVVNENPELSYVGYKTADINKAAE